MSQDTVEKILGRLLTDDGFRENLKNSFPKVCLEYGLVLTKQEESILMNMDFEKFTPLSVLIDRGIKRAKIE